MICCKKHPLVEASEFERVVKAFWAEVALNGPDQVLLQAGHRTLLINACRRELADRWDDLADVCGNDSGHQLRYVYLVISQIFPSAAHKATFLDMDLRISGKVQITTDVTIDILA